MDELRRFLLEAPVWQPTAVAVAGIVLLVAGLQRMDKVWQRAGGAVVVLAVVWGVVAGVVETPEEHTMRRTREAVRAYEAADWDALSRLVNDGTRFHTLYTGQDIVAAARNTHATLDHGSVRVSGHRLERDAAGIRVRIEVVSEQRSGMIARLTTAWQFDYSPWDDGWRLDRIEALPTDRIDVAGILGRVQPPR